jgi:hypothetical protein
LVGFLLAAGDAPALTIDQTGAPGAPGTLGEAGDPGTDGGIGGDGQSLDIVLDGPDTFNQVRIYSGAGGAGGSGGGGAVPGASGGDGGDGGAGGDAVTSVSAQAVDFVGAVRVRARGGAGGAGGLGGVGGGAPASNGTRGSGGDGGDVEVHAVARATRDSTEASTDDVAGGNGGAGLNGGRGGDAFAEFVAESEGSPQGFKFAQSGSSILPIRGGNGGDFYAGGAAGVGGNATMTARALGTRGASAFSFGNAAGGAGGDALELGSGGRGGDATAHASTVTTDAGRASASATAVGGTGGNPLGGGATRGGDGGIAGALAEAVAQGTGTAFAGVYVTGGAGGYALGGIGGNGASIALEDGVTGSSTTQLELQQIAIGGKGGSAWDGAIPGKGGNASSRLDAVNPGGGALRVTSEAHGGDAGFIPDGSGVTAGDAFAEGVGTDVAGRDLDVIARAIGGRGYRQTGFPDPPPATDGAATARATATGLGVLSAAASASGSGVISNEPREASSFASGVGAIRRVESRVFAPNGSPGQIDAISRRASTAPPPVLGAVGGTNTQGLAYGLAEPADSLVDARFAPGSRVGRALTGEDALALGILGVSLASDEFEASVAFQLAAPAPRGQLVLGLANPFAAGAGFSDLLFTIEIGGIFFVEQSFQDLAAALAYFQDALLVLPVGDALEVEIGMRAVVASTADRFRFDFVLAPIPEPASGALLLVGLVLLARARASRSRLQL